MATVTASGEKPPSLRAVARHVYDGVSDHRVDGLAAEVAFFSLFALPPALLALFGAVGFVGRALGPGVTAHVKAEILASALQFLTADTVKDVVGPVIDQLLSNGRIELLSIGVLFALWSTSKAADAMLCALHIAYRVDERLASWRRRGLAFLYTCVAILWGGLLLPALIVGPNFGRALASSFGFVSAFESVWGALYWPVVSVAMVGSLCAVYHFAIPWRTPFLRDLPGALFAMGLWLAGSYALRLYGRWTVESSSIYGSLASPMILLMWLYFAAFSVLMGAELNAAVEAVWPTVTRREKKQILREAVEARKRDGEEVAPVSVTGAPKRSDAARKDE